MPKKTVILEESSETVGAQTGVTVPITVAVLVDLIDPNPQQPRQQFDEAALKELAGSIVDHGLIQPIVVEPNGDRYTLHDGERRWRAHKIAGLQDIPAYIVPAGTDPQKLLLRAIVANDQRADLTPIERAQGYQRLADEHGLSDTEIAAQVGKSRSAVANTRRLLNLPRERQEQIAAGKLNERQAMSLLTYYQLPKQVQEEIAKQWSFRDVVANPEKFSSEDIRNSLRNSLSRVTNEIGPFAADDEVIMMGGGVRHSKCTDCPFYIKVLSREYRCTDEKCFYAKRESWQRGELQAAKEKTGYPTVDPGRELEWNDCTDFYSYSHLPVLEHALANQCPNLSLRCNIFPDHGMRPKGVSPYIQFTCIHPGKKGCLCENALKADEKEAQKEEEAEKKRLKGLAIQTIQTAFRGTHLPALKALAVYSAAPSKHDQIAASTDPDWLANLFATFLVERKFSTWWSAEDNRKALTEWLTQLGLTLHDSYTSATNEIDYIDDKIARLTAYLATQTEITQEIRNGNVANLNELVERLDDLYEQDLGSPHCNRIEALLNQTSDLMDILSQETIKTQHLSAVSEQLDIITALLREREEIPLLTLRQHRDRLREIFTTQIDLPGLKTNKENNDLLHRWEELVKQVDDRIENFQYKKFDLPKEPTP